jgi:hypothetical protein
MNTRDEWTITATIQEEPQRTLWSKVFPDAVIPIQKAEPYQINGPGDQKQMVYLLDLKAISRQQRKRLIWLLSVLWDMTPGDVAAEIHGGVPIEVEGVTVMASETAHFLARRVRGKESNCLVLYRGPADR